jgi:hypothetical protein
MLWKGGRTLVLPIFFRLVFLLQRHYTGWLPSSIGKKASSKKLTLVITAVYMNILTSRPAEIDMFGQHRVEYNGFIHFVSPYATNKNKMTLKYVEVEAIDCV